MKAFASFGPNDYRFVELPVPAPGPGEALVKTEGCVFCNTTDRMVMQDHWGAENFPVIPGHESFGRVVELGQGVKNLQLGDRVTRENAIPGGYNGTYFSAWGGFAEYGIVKDCSPVDGFGELPAESAGLMISLSEIASCIPQLGDVKGKTIVVLGTGAAGYAFVRFLRAFGASEVVCVGRRKERLEIAEKLGATRTLLFDELFDSGISADAAVEATGNPAVFERGAPYLKDGARVAKYGVAEQPYRYSPDFRARGFRLYSLLPQEACFYQYVCDLLRHDEGLANLLMTRSWSFGEMDAAARQVFGGEVVKGLVRME